MKRVSVLGSTGSIGTQTLEVIASSAGEFSVHSLASGSDASTVCDQMQKFGVRIVSMVDPASASVVREHFPDATVLDGPDAASELAGDPDADIVVNAIVGAAGLRATLAGLDAGHTVALANKESCVAGGPLVAQRIASGTGQLVPVDSEHAAVHMCLAGESASGVRELVLTASGGPFRGRDRESLSSVTLKDALAHPTWEMGPKISIDSATLMNKGLEVIEAHILFGFDYDAISTVGHPQSVIHCLIGFVDGSWKASLSPPDMRVPIAYALGYPDRPSWGAASIDWTNMRDLTFEPLDVGTFACLQLAYDAGRAGGTAPAVLNAANEVAVQAFLDSRIGLLQIADTVEAVLNDHEVTKVDDLSDVEEADAWARRNAEARISR